MDKNMLLDTWQVEGTSFDELYKITEAIDKATKYFECDLKNLVIFTFYGIKNGKASGYLHIGSKSVPKSYEINELVSKHGATPELLSELEHNSMMLFDQNGYVFYTTKNVLTTLSQRGGSRLGESDLSDMYELRFYRDAKYTTWMATKEKERCHVIYREIGGAKKVIGVLTDRHAEIKQTDSIKAAINTLKGELGEPDLKRFCINSSSTELYVEYPDKKDDYKNVKKEDGTLKGNIPDEVVPGAIIRTSDGGESSFTVIGTLRIGKNRLMYVPAAKAKRAHTKKATIDVIKDLVDRRVHKEFTRIPNRLCELLTIDVPCPVLALEKIASYCNIKAALGLGVKNDVIRNIEASINPSVNYTAYDIAMMFLDEGVRLETEKNRDETIDKIRACFVQAVFFRYEAL